MSTTGLTHTQLGYIQSTLEHYAPEATMLCVFGSRATGRYKAESDLDLVVYGPVAQSDIDRLFTVFEESFLPIRVDILAYDLITHAPLRHHIDEAAKPLLVGV
jgi:uncharacterized protein